MMLLSPSRNPKAVEAWISAVFLDRKFYSDVGVAVSTDTQEPTQVGSSDTLPANHRTPVLPKQQDSSRNPEVL